MFRKTRLWMFPIKLLRHKLSVSDLNSPFSVDDRKPKYLSGTQKTFCLERSGISQDESMEKRVELKTDNTIEKTTTSR